MSRVTIVPFDLPQARVYATQFAELARLGQVIGDRDLQIASTALCLGYDVATLNVSEFQRLPRLRLVDVAPYVVA